MARLLTSAICIATFIWTADALSAADDNKKNIQSTNLWKVFTNIDASEVASITAGNRGKYFVFGRTYSKLAGESHWWGELKKDGTKLRESKDWDARGFRNSRVVALTQTADDDIWVVGTRTVSKFTADAKLVFSKSIYKITPIKRYMSNISSSIPTVSGGLVLVGMSQNKRAVTMDAWVIAIDKHGKRLWEKSFDFGKDEWAVAAARGKKGNLYVAAITGTSDKFGAGFRGVRILKCSPKGKKLAEYSTKGTITPMQMPSIAVSSGRIYVGYSQSFFPQLDAWILCLDAKLKKVWEKQLAAPHLTISTTALATSANGDLIATWNSTKDTHLWRLDKNGKELHRRTIRKARGFFVPTKSGGGRLFIQKMK